MASIKDAEVLGHICDLCAAALPLCSIMVLILTLFFMSHHCHNSATILHWRDSRGTTVTSNFVVHTSRYHQTCNVKDPVPILQPFQFSQCQKASDHESARSILCKIESFLA
jgi:hypothetical protein